MEKNNAKISFDAALQMALYAQMERDWKRCHRRKN